MNDKIVIIETNNGDGSHIESICELIKSRSIKYPSAGLPRTNSSTSFNSTGSPFSLRGKFPNSSTK